MHKGNSSHFHDCDSFGFGYEKLPDSRTMNNPRSFIGVSHKLPLVRSLNLDLQKWPLPLCITARESNVRFETPFVLVDCFFSCCLLATIVIYTCDFDRNGKWLEFEECSSHECSQNLHIPIESHPHHQWESWGSSSDSLWISQPK